MSKESVVTITFHDGTEESWTYPDTFLCWEQPYSWSHGVLCLPMLDSEGCQYYPLSAIRSFRKHVQERK